MAMKKIMIILSVWSCCFFFAGCSSKSTDANILNAETSIFDSHTMEQTETACIIKGRVSQKNDNNAVAVIVHAEENATINISGTLTKINGSDTELIYMSSNGKTTKITDNFSDTFSYALNVSEGEGKIIFAGETAVYDFEIELELIDGVSYSDS